MFNRSNRSIDLSGKLSGPSEEKKGIGQYLGDEFLRANDCFPSFGEDNDEAQRVRSPSSPPKVEEDTEYVSRECSAKSLWRQAAKRSTTL